jgi:hypothetical protein
VQLHASGLSPMLHTTSPIRLDTTRFALALGAMGRDDRTPQVCVAVGIAVRGKAVALSAMTDLHAHGPSAQRMVPALS